MLQVLKPAPQVTPPPHAVTKPEAVTKEVETKGSSPPATNSIDTAFAAQVSGATNTIYCPANRIYCLCGIGPS